MKKGFFTGKLNMLPVLTDYTPIYQGVTQGFDIPKVTPQAPIRLQKEGFYRFTGALEIKESAVYQFRINSCGPVQFTLDGQKLLDVTGQYGLSQKDRFAEIALAPGIHTLELVITDPVFWKGELEEDYQIEVSMKKATEKEYQALETDLLYRTDRNEFMPLPGRPIKQYSAVKTELTAGLVEKRFDRQGIAKVEYAVRPIPGAQRDEVPATEGINPETFAIENSVPYSVRAVTSLTSHDVYTKIKEYSGYFIATVPGIYRFKLDTQGTNELYIHQTLVFRNKINGAQPEEDVYLEKGAHPLSLRLAQSQSTFLVQSPMDEDFRSVSAAELARNKDLVIQEEKPEDRLVAHLPLKELSNGKTPIHGQSSLKVEVRGGEITEDPVKGTVIRLSGKGSGIRMEEIDMLDDASTFSAWVFTTNNKPVYLVNRYPSIYSEYNNGVITANYDRSQDKLISNRPASLQKGEWVHVAITFDNAIKAYINGEFVGVVNIDRTILRGASSRYTDLNIFNDRHMNQDIDIKVMDVRLYNKVLTLGEIKEIYNPDL
ncbi:MAG: hypothetical protein LUE93_17045 [Bacteroides sp.]|nr:hypothetical protein [Bacteroides sp.]